ncbi:MAG: hypothetical protein ACJ76H_13655 [Bacteriovoracaceae bacterium]
MKLALFLILLSSTAFADYTFLMRDKRAPDRPFFVRLFSSNHPGINSFESYLQKGTVTLDEQGNPAIGVMSGPLIHTARTPMHDWDFSIDGHSLEFADLTQELCDATFMDVESNEDYWFNTVGRLCPWFTRFLVQEIQKNGKVIYHRD